VSPVSAYVRAAGAAYVEVPAALRRPKAGARPRTAATGVVLVTVAMAASAFWLGIRSGHLPHPVATAFYSAYLVLAFGLIGLYWWLRRRASRFGPLLMTCGVLAWIYSWESAGASLPFSLGVLVEGPLTFLTFYLFLAFPSGRLTTPAERVLMAALGVSLLGFFGVWALTTPVLAGGGPLAGCTPACPANALQVTSASPALVERAGDAETYLGLVVTAGVVVVYAVRFGSATPPQRRALLAVASTSLLFLPVFFVYHAARGLLGVDPARLETLGWVLLGCRVLLPLGFLVALLQAELFGARVLRTLVDRIATRPTRAQWRDTLATALDDPPLQVGYWDPEGEEYRRADDQTLSPPVAGSGRAWVPAEQQNGRPMAALTIDEALLDDPELVRAATAVTVLAVENGALEVEAKITRERILEAGYAERRRIERDLHDSAQQRLIALGIRLSRAGEQLGSSAGGALVEELSTQVDEALNELRRMAGGAPPLLTEEGIAAGLRAVASWSPIEVTVFDDGVRRHSEALESTVYYCCLEALQNAAKHGGRDISATVRLTEDHRVLTFAVEDDGAGFNSGTVRLGAGLVNLAERVSAVGGTLSVDSAPGQGTRIVGRLPV
jgi:signal transduction histidine kinase